MEALLYALGLLSGTIMPEVKACESVRLVFRVGPIRWSATRGSAGRSATVVFEDLTTSGAPVTRLVKPGKPSEESASDFTLGLLGIPVLKSGEVKLNLDLVRSVFTARQEYIATRFLNGLSAKERTLTLDVLLRLRDKELDDLESAFHRVEREYSEIRSTINRYVKARQNAGLDADIDVRREQDRKRREHADVAAEREAVQQILSDMETDQGRFDREEEQAYNAYQQARRDQDAARERCQQAAQELGVAQGYLKAVLQQFHDDGHCPRCSLALPARQPGHCAVCDQLHQQAVQAPQWDELVAVARESVEAAEKKMAAHGRQAEQIAAVAHKAWLVLEDARTKSVAHRARTAPERSRVRALEKRADKLSGELEQLEKRLKEQAVLTSLRNEMEERRRAMKDAQHERDAARKKRQRRRTDLLGRLARLVLARLQAILPHVYEVEIDPDDYSLTIDGKPFSDISVAGGPKTAVNVAFLLALQDLAREETDVLIPPLLVIDAPLTGFSSQGLDEETSRRMLDQLLSAADPHGDEEAASQVITAVNDPLPRQRTATVEQIMLSTDNRFFDHAPLCPQ
ncbi:hypothetical protein [Streptomyces sp. NPDC058644]|uniref:hypothetical protein n=1 Tax=unclassified Streptomyces TaxID=2593676 RepID=UPI0036600037